MKLPKLQAALQNGVNPETPASRPTILGPREQVESSEDSTVPDHGYGGNDLAAGCVFIY